jgi:4a-hydroxytetrahydrobiopterin dehydratase
MNAVAAECAVKKHHPEWSNVYNTTFIRWTTHSPPGLSVKDVDMAAFCDLKAREFGELVVEQQQPRKEGEGKGDGKKEGEGDVMCALADRVASEGGDCCVPKSKR